MVYVSTINQPLNFSSKNFSKDKILFFYFRYYALCLDFQLDTGYTVIPYKTVEDFVREEEESLIVVRDPEAERRLYTSLWLWYVLKNI